MQSCYQITRTWQKKTIDLRVQYLYNGGSYENVNFREEKFDLPRSKEVKLISISLGIETSFSAAVRNCFDEENVSTDTLQRLSSSRVRKADAFDMNS